MRRAVFAVCLIVLFVFPVAAEDATPEAIPPAMPLVDEGGQDILNILLIGSATNNPEKPPA